MMEMKLNEPMTRLLETLRRIINTRSREEEECDLAYYMETVLISLNRKNDKSTIEELTKEHARMIRERRKNNGL